MFRVLGSMMPYRDRAFDIYKRNFSEASAVGFLSAILFTVFSDPVKNLVDFGEKWMELTGIPYQMNIAMLGFIVGYGTVKILLLLRMQIFIMLLNYQGWMFNPKSTTTKMWALMLNCLRGSGNYPTFFFEPLLPPLPVPSLNSTCDKCLASMKAILSDEDFIHFLTAMEKFREKEGPELQKYMLQRYATKRNWLSEIWLNVAYLSSREPTAVNVNCFALDRKVQPTTNQLARASNMIHAVLRNHQMILQEALIPQYLQDLIPLTMEGYRNLNCTCRIPGIEVDTLKTWKDSKHVIVYRKGVYVKFDGFALDVDGKETVLTVEEIYNILQQIVNISDDAKDFSPVAVFTAQKRDVWAKVRNRMLENTVNRQSLEDVESSLSFFVLEEESPKTKEEESIFNMCGNGANRWFDKSMQYFIYANGKIGVNAEHSATDATLPGRVWEYILGTEKYTENGDIEKISKAQQRKLPVLQKLEWDLRDFEVDLETAFVEYKNLASSFNLQLVSADYGKGWIKKKRMSPDGYIQMALQLAYYRLYKKIPKTYESASTRIFAQGRTETIRPVSELSIQWVKSMLSDRTTKEQKILLLKKAIQYQTRYKTEAGCGQGWDRHMLGMYIISKQINMPTPELFQQQALWRPDDLSTSQTPTRYTNLWTLENSAFGGGFAPVNPRGYGVSYNIVGEDLILFYVSSNAHCTETSTTKMADSILDALAEMKELLS